MIEENVVSAAGTTPHTTIDDMRRHILDAGFRPARRRQDYSIIADEKAA
jgi:cyclic dehypoxanthinyl futalosine synthase